jgi:hypothetical protein
MKLVLTIAFLFLFYALAAQENPIQKKELTATRIQEKITVDGLLEEPAWEQAERAKDFVMFRPGNGDKEPEDLKTEISILYDDEAIYVAARLYDANPRLISKELSDRDNLGNTDFIAIVINPNNDGQNEFEFFVTAAGVQLDAQVSPSNGEDFIWSEVWFSEALITDQGWFVEMKIPYAALRMPEVDAQLWGLNIHRRIERKREQYTWNFIDKSKGSPSQYAGILKGINNIDPPVRLSFFPFTSFIVSDFDGETDGDFNFGMDIKYGITDNFTLNATLIPDFSQAGFDDITLNLGPFEQVFTEQRQFFIEGADLLNKGDLFFSRRIGNRPVGNDDVGTFVEENPNYEIVSNPTEVDVLNVVKVTGRTQAGLGLAFLNAVTAETEAVIRDTLTLEKKKIITEPIANYNVFVIDQEFNKNSSVGLANTNVLRSGDFRDANVSSLVFNLANRKNSYALTGDASTSTVREDQENTTGFASNLAFRKTEGKFRYALENRFSDEKYDKNDLGFNQMNNYLDFTGNLSYQIFEPTKTFNSYRLNFFAGHFRRFDPNVYTGTWLEMNAFFQLLNQFAFGANVGTNIGERTDFFEPRTEGRYWVKDPSTEIYGWISTDYRKKFAIDVRGGFEFNTGNAGYEYSAEISPRYRFSDKFSLIYGVEREYSDHELGYVTTLEDGTIIFGKRERKEVENVLTGKYSFSDRSSLSLALRNYWSPVKYRDQYYTLLENGDLQENNYTGENDINFHSWNFDLRYVWVFSRGSELVVLYRNSLLDAENEQGQSEENYFNNVSNLFDQPFGHSFSVKLVYFLDYNQIRTWVK